MSVATDELRLPLGEPEVRFMNPSSVRVPWVFQAEGQGLWLLLSQNRLPPCTWTHVSYWLLPLCLHKEEGDGGRGRLLFMPLELHPFSNSLEVEAKLHSPKYGRGREGLLLGHLCPRRCVLHHIFLLKRGWPKSWYTPQYSEIL